MKNSIPIKIVGVHRYPVTEELFHETLKYQWGEDLSGDELEEAKANVNEHFENLYLLEMVMEKPIPDFDWAEVTQEIPHQPKENWQVAYNEEPLDESGRRWAFFFHYLDLKKPLLTPVGEVPLPELTNLPHHLKRIKYEAP